MNTAEPFAKISLYATDNQGNSVTEYLGYTDINLFDSTTATSLASALKNFAQDINYLTTNTYKRSDVSYSVELDTFTP